MPEISIIVPVYKVEQYIHKCIDSILAQTFTDFEVILVDDGSPDQCGKICDAYAQQDDRVRVIHKKNGGLSDARNAGLDIAQGKYIGFVDSDDYIDDDMYETLYSDLVHNNADISVCGLYHCYDQRILPHTKEIVYKVCTDIEIIEMVMSAKIISVNAYNKLYRADLFGDIRYPVGRTTEDAFIILDILRCTKKTVVNSSPKYYYVHRDNSITTASFTAKDYNVIDAYKKNLMLIEECYPKLIDVAKYRLYWSYRYFIERILLDHNRDQYNKELHDAVSIIRKEVRTILNNPYNSMRQKFGYILVCINPTLYMYILKAKIFLKCYI